MVLGPIDGLWELFFFRPGFRNLPKKLPPKSLRLTSVFHVFVTKWVGNRFHELSLGRNDRLGLGTSKIKFLAKKSKKNWEK